MTVVATAYQTARQMNASPKVMLALFEAGIVESGFRNLNYGDRDSLGFLQQRPSQGWPNPMDVPTATKSFVTRAMHNEPMYATSGELAQSVQISAFPAKYDAVQAEASVLLKTVAGGNYAVIPASTATVPAGMNIGQLMSDLTSGNIVKFLMDAGGMGAQNLPNLAILGTGVKSAVEFEQRLMSLFSFNTLVRIAMFIVGFWCILIAVILFVAQTTVGDAAKSAAFGYVTKGKSSTLRGAVRHTARQTAGNAARNAAKKGG